MEADELLADLIESAKELGGFLVFFDEPGEWDGESGEVFDLAKWLQRTAPITPDMPPSDFPEQDN